MPCTTEGARVCARARTHARFACGARVRKLKTDARRNRSSAECAHRCPLTSTACTHVRAHMPLVRYKHADEKRPRVPKETRRSAREAPSKTLARPASAASRRPPCPSSPESKSTCAHFQFTARVRHRAADDRPQLRRRCTVATPSRRACASRQRSDERVQRAHARAIEHPVIDGRAEVQPFGRRRPRRHKCIHVECGR